MCLSTLAAKNLAPKQAGYEPHTCDADAPRAALIRACPQKDTCARRAPRQTSQSHCHSLCNQTRATAVNQTTMRRIVAVATVAAARAQLDAAGHAAAAPARRDPIDTTPGLRGGAAPAAASIQKEDEDYSACTTVAAELAFARLEIAALQHDNAVLASENRVLANARNLPEVVADVREHIRHVVDGDDAVPCKPEV